MSRVRVAPLAELPLDEGFLFRHGPFQVALFRTAAGVVAIDNECPHAGASLVDGHFDPATGAVSCPWHGWEFDVATGACLSVPGYNCQSFAVRIEDGTVVLDLG